MRWVWRLLQCNWKHSVLLTHSKNLLHPSIIGQMFSEAFSFTPQVGPIPLKINSLPIPLASTTKALMKTNWIVCGFYDQAIKPGSVSQRTRNVVVDGRSVGTICTPWPHLILPSDPKASLPGRVQYTLLTAFRLWEGPFPWINGRIFCFCG